MITKKITISTEQNDWVALLLKEKKITDFDGYIAQLISADISKNDKLNAMFKAIEKRITEGDAESE